MNAMSGGALTRMSIAALGIGPFISATIITQVLTVFVPSLFRLSQKRTRNDEKKMDRINIIIALLIAIAESLVFAVGFAQAGILRENNIFYITLTAAIWTGASVFISCMGKLITNRFIGNGVSLILFMNIVCGFPSDIVMVKETLIDGSDGINTVVLTAIITAAVFAIFIAAYVVQKTEKRLPVIYKGKLSNDISGKRLNYLPLKLCPGSVMPVVFTGAVFSFPAILFTLIGTGSETASGFFTTTAWFDPNHLLYTLGAVGYAALIVFFTFLYNNISANPVEISEAIEKRGGMVAGKHPGKETADFIKIESGKMLKRGCVFTVAIAILPIILSNILDINGIAFLGTSVIIITGTVIETYNELYAASLASAERKKLDKGGLL